MKHLELIQAVIIRLSINSFMLKGWSVTLVSALMALSVNTSNAYFIILAYIPSIVFWGLDGYFLSAERLYRKLYDQVRLKDEKDIDFSMKTVGLNEKKQPWLSATFSKTLIPFHGSIVISIIILIIIHK